MFLSLRLPQPLLLEGEAGVGKTEAGKSLAAMLDTPLIRLQCYDGIDAAEALYEWNYPRQLLSIRLADASGTKISEEELFGPDYLIRRPLLRALEHPGPRPAVLLIDEIDRADDDFEAFLLELLADAAVTIPEIGTVRATHPPVIVLTSNRTRDLHDAVKRRCLYHWIDYPTPEREVEIVRRRVKGAPEVLAVQVADAVARIRDSDVQKPPGVAEAIDWVAALDLLGVEELDEAAVDRTLGSVLKYSEDQEVVRAAGLSSSSRDDRPGLHRTHASPRPAGRGRRLRPAPARGRRHDTADRAARSRARSSWAGRSRAGGCTGLRARSWLRTARSSGHLTPCSPRCSARASGAGARARGRGDGPAPERGRPGQPRRAGAGGGRHRHRRPPGDGEDELRDVVVPVAASDEEVLRSKHFDALSPAELAQVYRLMERLEVATPTRRTRRSERDRHGKRIDMRRTLRGSSTPPATRSGSLAGAAVWRAGAWSCCATSRARWSPTRAPTSSS